MSVFATIRAWFTPAVIDIVLPDPNRAVSKMGLKLVAIDQAKTRWILVEGMQNARCDRNGVWHLPTEAMNETFVFALSEGKKMAVVQSSSAE